MICYCSSLLEEKNWHFLNIYVFLICGFLINDWNVKNSCSSVALECIASKTELFMFSWIWKWFSHCLLPCSKIELRTIPSIRVVAQFKTPYCPWEVCYCCFCELHMTLLCSPGLPQYSSVPQTGLKWSVLLHTVILSGVLQLPEYATEYPV